MIEGEKKINFRNDGGPHRTADGKIKAPGRIFKAYPSEITESMRIHIKPLDTLPDSETAPLPDTTVSTGYELIEKGAGYYNVVQKASGNVMNEKGLRKVKAEELVKSLEG